MVVNVRTWRWGSGQSETPAAVWCSDFSAAVVGGVGGGGVGVVDGSGGGGGPRDVAMGQQASGNLAAG